MLSTGSFICATNLSNYKKQKGRSLISKAEALNANAIIGLQATSIPTTPMNGCVEACFMLVGTVMQAVKEEGWALK